jgi:hypothetical protein
LGKNTESDIIDFEIILRTLLDDLDDYRIVAAQKIMAGMVSDDSYLYFRCWIIGNGRDFFEKVLQVPDFITDRIDAFDFPSFESLLYISTQAFHDKTGREEDEAFPRSIASKRGLDYDFGPLKTKGSVLSENEAKSLYPRLWAYCRSDAPNDSVFKVFADSGMYGFPWNISS